MTQLLFKSRHRAPPSDVQSTADHTAVVVYLVERGFGERPHWLFIDMDGLRCGHGWRWRWWCWWPNNQQVCRFWGRMLMTRHQPYFWRALLNGSPLTASKSQRLHEVWKQVILGRWRAYVLATVVNCVRTRLRACLCACPGLCVSLCVPALLSASACLAFLSSGARGDHHTRVCAHTCICNCVRFNHRRVAWLHSATSPQRKS